MPDWWVYRYPFRHFHGQSVLDAAQYSKVCAAFRRILADTATGNGAYTLKKTNPKYDAKMLGINDDLATSFAPFFSRDWIRSLYEVVQLPEVLRIDGGLHSSAKGSHDGWIHNDLCSGWFNENSGESFFPDRRRCEYFTGQSKTSDARPVEYIRAATMIFYLCNEGWSPGDGGETGFYSASRQTSHTRTKLIPPVDNSILMFECSPHSFHRFIANPGRDRNSLILWLHSSVEDAEARWGNAINRRRPS